MVALAAREARAEAAAVRAARVLFQAMAGAETAEALMPEQAEEAAMAAMP